MGKCYDKNFLKFSFNSLSVNLPRSMSRYFVGIPYPNLNSSGAKMLVMMLI